ncbi:MAG: hypothetical protein JSS82_03960 [Bacteroidetes bacterium]|nr:hypothetical protein [Bacteroidota bacterium]
MTTSTGSYDGMEEMLSTNNSGGFDTESSVNAGNQSGFDGKPADMHAPAAGETSTTSIFGVRSWNRSSDGDVNPQAPIDPNPPIRYPGSRGRGGFYNNRGRGYRGKGMQNVVVTKFSV